MDNSPRSAAIQEVEDLLNDTKEWTSAVLDDLQWTEENILQDERVPCPHNPKHIVHPASVSSHADICPKLEKGYTKEELAKDQSSAFFYEKSEMVTPIHLNEDKLKAILSMCGGENKELPLTMERYISDLTSEQRLKIYEFCMESVKAMNKQVSIPEEELMLLEDTKKGRGKEEKTYLERIAEERDFKRRRQSYRAKNVHITKKTHTEIIREVILNQMELLSEMWEDDNNKRLGQTSRSPEPSSEGQRSQHTESTPQDDYIRYDERKRSRSRERERSHREQYDRGRRSRSPDRYNSKSRYNEDYRSRDRYRSERGRRSRSRDRKRSRDRNRSRSRDRKSYKTSHKVKKSRHRSVSREPEVKKTAVNLWSLPDKK